MNKLFTLLTLTIFTFNIALAQSTNYWTDVAESEIVKNGTRQISPLQYRTVKLDIVGLKQHLANAPMENNSTESPLRLSFPMPDGTTQVFKIVESPIMESGLASQFPEIKTYLGVGIDDPLAKVRFDWTYKGFHAMIMTPNGWTFIDPYHSNTNEEYITYYKKDFVTNKSFQCEFDPEIHGVSFKEDPIINLNTRNVGEQLRTYRLALACTGEYAQFHGGTVNSVLSAMTTTMNRVNGVYENEVAVRMIIVNNNSSLIFLNPNTDPFSNNNTGQLINQSQTEITNIIGTNNFDIGHVFSTGAGGLAGLGVVCRSNQKGRGVTGISQPIGDPFDIDYVAHEMGHQFGGNHTFNGSSGSCTFNISTNAAYEPGSGTTIQAYAGICTGQNVQNNSDAYFHTHSFDEMITYSQVSSGNNCPLITNTGNTAPIVSAGTGGFTIPKSTPFELVGTATDPDGDPMTYCWEQHDLGPQGAPNSPSGNAPIFRSFSPIVSPSRTFPQISDIVNNTQTLGEILPSYSRNLEFRLTARDNQIGGGGVTYDVINFSVTDAAGPFLVTNPNIGNEVWTEGSVATVNWDVANTDNAPINSDKVDILLSTDGGYTYTYTLASDVSNNGTFNIIVPIGSSTTQARVRVQAANNIFFDISNQNFTIQAPTVPDYVLFPIETAKTICGGTDTSFSFLLISLLNYADDINLTAVNVPNGITASFSSNPATPGDTVQVIFTNTENASTGLYPIEIQASSNNNNQGFTLDLTIFSSIPSVVTKVSPIDGDANTSTSPNLTWNAPGGATHTYDVRVASDPNFMNIVSSANNLTDTSYIAAGLEPYNIYYWQVKASNQCAVGDWSETTAFRTATSTCEIITGGEQKNIISGIVFTYESDLTVTQDVVITDVNVLDATISHLNISDISLGLKSPLGTEVQLLPQSCSNVNGTAGWVLDFDDESVFTSFPCGNSVNTGLKPQEALANFNGESAKGTWKMQVTDNVAGNGGSFQTYSLEICYALPNDNEDPILINNELLEVSIGKSKAIKTEQLLSTDTDNIAADLVYTIVSNTTKGKLYLNGTSLNVNATFTQVDIDNGNLSYEHEGTDAEKDSFQFDIRDGNGGWFGTPYFVITAEEPNGLATADDPLRVYPNPTKDYVNVDFYLLTEQNVTIFIFDAIGKEVKEYQYANVPQGSNILSISVNDLSSGTYFLHLVSDDFNGTEKVLIIND